jgi:hypothetical protein
VKYSKRAGSLNRRRIIDWAKVGQEDRSKSKRNRRKVQVQTCGKKSSQEVELHRSGGIKAAKRRNTKQD